MKLNQFQIDTKEFRKNPRAKHLIKAYYHLHRHGSSSVISVCRELKKVFRELREVA